MNNEWSDDDDNYEYDYGYTYNYEYEYKTRYEKKYAEIMYIHTTEPSKKYSIFLLVEKLFNDEISLYKKEYIETISMCYSIQDKQGIIKIGDKIKEIFPYNILGNYDLYLTLIFIYYSLLSEPGEEIFEGWFLNKHALNNMVVIKLYFMLTTGDLIEQNGNNLSKYVRRYFLGLL
jgi:hypothetical protein